MRRLANILLRTLAGRASRTTAGLTVCALAAAALAACSVDDDHDGHDARAGSGQVRTYYIAADKVRWDYAPSGRNLITGKPFDDTANVFVKSGPGRIGRVYWKAQYRQYTGADFRTRTEVPSQWKHLGLLGPAIHAEVGDTIKVVFRNNLDRPASVHPHGVHYDKGSEGAPYDDGTTGDAKADDGVPPGGTHTYTWTVPERAGPGHMDASSTMWMYHSHVDEAADVYAGLMGPMIITRAGMARPDGTPKDVDRELVVSFQVDDENQSWYLDDNVKSFAKGEAPAEDAPDFGDFEESNLMHAMNGFVYGNLPGLDARQGERVRWYLMGMGTEVDLHTPHWHGDTVVIAGMRTDTTTVLPATMQVADMKPDNPGKWLFHCHVNDHISAGMQAVYTVGAAG